MNPIPLRWILGAVGLVLAGLALWWLVATVTGGKSAKTEAELAGNRGEAMAGSAADSVNTIGTRNASENEIDEGVKDAQHAIDDAGSAGAADAAARGGLCDADPDYC